MRAKIGVVLLVCLLGGSLPVLYSQESGEAATVRVLEMKWAESYRLRQLEVLSALLDDDYVITFEDGRTLGKVGVLSYIAKPSERIEAADLSDLKIRIRHDTAIVTGAYHERGESAGKPYDYNDRLTDVWMKVQGNWKLVASHYSVPSQ